MLTRGGGNPWDTHICQTHSVPLPQAAWMSFSTAPPVPFCPPLSRGERKWWEWEICGFDQRKRGKSRFFEYEFNGYISWLYSWFRRFNCVYLCVYVLQFTFCMYLPVCIKTKSASKRVERTLSVSPCHRMSQHVVYWSCCWSNNRALPSESQCASLAAAISALVPLLITSVDHLCAIS